MTWEEIPNGFCLTRTFHERTGKYCHHLHLKVNDGEWFDQINVPSYSEEACERIGTNRDFWEWAKNNLPIYEHPIPVKSSHA